MYHDIQYFTILTALTSCLFSRRLLCCLLGRHCWRSTKEPHQNSGRNFRKNTSRFATKIQKWSPPYHEGLKFRLKTLHPKNTEVFMNTKKSFRYKTIPNLYRSIQRDKSPKKTAAFSTSFMACSATSWPKRRIKTHGFFVAKKLGPRLLLFVSCIQTSYKIL